jgi:hypothetical protein
LKGVFHRFSSVSRIVSERPGTGSALHTSARAEHVSSQSRRMLVRTMNGDVCRVTER